MPSSPESGPSRMSTFSFSTRRRASAVALSGVASEQPKARRIGRPATSAPLTPSCGPVPCACPPAFWIRAYFAPEKDCSSNTANGPPQVVSMPILIGPFSPPPPSSPSSPQPVPTSTATRAATARAASRADGHRRRAPYPIRSSSRLRINQESIIVAPWYRADVSSTRGGARAGGAVATRWGILPRRRLVRRGQLGGSLAIAVALAAIAWVLYKAFGDGLGRAGNVPQFVVVTLNGLSLAGLYFITASGFTLIFGLMRVVNMAHGSLYLLGAYIGLSLIDDGTPWLLAVMLAGLFVGAVGLVMQQLFLRWNQGQELRQALITIGLSIILADQMIAHFDPTPRTLDPPRGLTGSVGLGVYGLDYPAFRLFVIGAALLVALLLWLLIKRTRFGIVIRAGVDNAAMASALGVNVQVVFAAAFFLGSALAGLAGVFGGTVLSVAPGQDSKFLLSSLIVVIIGGMGSLAGAALGALALGLVEQLSSVYLPEGYTNYSILLTFILLIVVLAVRPTGIFGRPE